MSLFDSGSVFEPLAARMRPAKLSDLVGQEHLLAKGKPLREAIESSTLHSMILWGPPGVGKTTIARMLAEECNVRFESISAVLSGVKEIRAAIAVAKQNMANSVLSDAKKTVLFVDEVHRFNKSQQDAFLPFIEDGTILFIGATTENPSFELNNALLSRARVYKLTSLGEESLLNLLKRALQDKVQGLGNSNLKVQDEVLMKLVKAADGDGRRALNLLEIASDLASNNTLDDLILQEVLGSDFRRFDKGGDLFYDQISALHKAVRGSSPDAALYWFARMIDGGCDPMYIARRVVRMASEDIGNADPRALEISLNAWQVQERLGSPEGELAIAQAIAYLAVAAKSNAVYSAYGEALNDAAKLPGFEVPLHIRNAPTNLMKEMGHGDDYRYAHNFDDGFVAGESYMPEELQDRSYYEPVNRGLEIQIKEKLEKLRAANNQSDFSRYKKESPR